ncbi:MAG: DNA polymerase III subunit alpha [Selenomonadaceae bacterium]|nr:DNA polymerase III subunit alpha [Selenomonadaceae bacterium]
MSFVHLHVHTAYSLLDGASRIKDLIARTKDLGMTSLAITDHGSMYGALEFYRESMKQGIKPIIGCEVYLAPESRFDRREIDGMKYFHLILLAETNQGYQNLVKLVSRANIDGFYYKPRIDKDLLREFHEGLICLSACIAGEIPVAILNKNLDRASKLIDEYVEIFGRDNFFLEIQNHGLPAESIVREKLKQLASIKNLKLVATNDLHYINRGDSDFHDVLLCVQMGKTIDSPKRLKFNSDDYYLKSPEEMSELFRDFPEAIENSNLIADRCNVEIEFGKLQLPSFPIPTEFETAAEYLRDLCEKNLSNRYENQTPEILERLDTELQIIHQMGFDEYFLIVWDFIHWAKSKNIAVGPGRGSAAGSIVAYLLEITEIDPLRFNLLFERFLNPERVTMPDIDVDFCYLRRDEVIEYVRSKYGEDHVAQIATFGTFAAKAAIRDVGRVFDLSVAEVNRIAKFIPNTLNMTIDRALEESIDFLKLYQSDSQTQKIIDFAKKIEGLPRHVSTHAAGVVIARDSLLNLVPVQTTEMIGRNLTSIDSKKDLITQYDKDQIEDLGLLKIDFLGLRTLTVITDTIELVRKFYGIEIELDKIPDADSQTSKMLCEGKTGAVFQMESQGMTNLVVKMKPERFEDLIPLVALFRPGPLGSGMVEDFIARKHGERQIEYLHPELEPILRETFGIILYQEQVMQIVQRLAGFTLGQADLLRRAMGKKKAEILLAQKENFLRGCSEHGIDSKLAEQIFDLMKSFADYGFNKSHSVAYGLLAWQTAYLKAHYPAEYMAAMLTSVADTDRVGNYIELAKQMHLRILSPDVNSSIEKFSVEDKTRIRFGFSAIKGLGDLAAKHLIKIRGSKKFESLSDFCRRIDIKILPKHAIESLIKAGAFNSIDSNRAKLLEILDSTVEEASIYQSERSNGRMSLFGEEDLNLAAQIKIPDVPTPSREKIIAWEKESLGFFMTNPMEEFAEKFSNLNSLREILDGKFSDGAKVRVAGVVTSTRITRTKKNDRMLFATLDDSSDSIDLTIFPNSLSKLENLFETGKILVLQCTVDLKTEVPKLIVIFGWRAEDYQRSFYLRMPSIRENPELWIQIADTVEKFRGDFAVILNGKKYANVSANCFDEFKKILGDENVIWM